VKAEHTPGDPHWGETDERAEVDLASNTYILDFVLWFSWEPTQFMLKQAQDFF
jgi:hypothetical protein